MKCTFILGLLFLVNAVCFSSPGSDSLIAQLDNAIKTSTLFDNSKLKEIARLKTLLAQPNANNISQQYQIHLKLYNEYQYYNFDSGFLYAKRLQQIAEKINDPSLIVDAKLKGVFILLSGGMFKETFDSLKVISLTNVADTVKSEYYTLIGRSFYNLSDFYSDSIYSPIYNNRANLYLDSAIELFVPGSFDHLYYSAIKFLKKGNADSAIINLNALIKRTDLTYHQVALTTSTLGGIYMSQGNENKAKPYLILASIADLKSSTKETLALLNLAGIVYKEGNLDEALLFIEKANADATFYNARLRKVQIGAILPLIEGGMINTIRTQKQKLQVYIIILSILVLLLAVFAIIIRKQVKKLKAARASLFQANEKQQQINKELLKANELKEKYNNQLQATNEQLVEANSSKEKYNHQLKETNTRLLEANKIKEEYIGYYFNSETAFLSRMEKLINSLDKKIIERKWDDIRYLLKTVDPKKEKEEILKNFDKVFLRLFPNFVIQFNSLFKEEDRIVLKEDQLLNTDLRIFALIRMGITENEKIAEILDYSINTIYAKKTRIRSKTIVAKEEFEAKIAQLTTISS